MPGLTPKDYKDAIQVQDACNLSGVVHTFSRIVTKIWEEANMNQKSTDWVNHHPIAILYADKIAHLATGSTIDSPEVTKAWQICEERGEE